MISLRSLSWLIKLTLGGKAVEERVEEDDFDAEYLPHRLDEILREIRAKSSGSYLIDGDHSSSYSTSTLAESRCDHLEEDTRTKKV